MVSAETKMALARLCVVAHIIAAGIAAAVILSYPVFELHIGATSSKIVQTLFTTSITTPTSSYSIDVVKFTEKCSYLQNGFRFAQGFAIAAAALLGLAFVYGVLHVTPCFIKTNRDVRCMCGVPLCLLLLLAVASLGLEGYVLQSMYWEENNCDKEMLLGQIFSEPAGNAAAVNHNHNNGHSVVAAPAILRENLRPLAMQPRHRAQDADVTAFVHAPIQKLHTRLATPLSSPTQGEPLHQQKWCNPFDNCLASFHDMGFETATGYKAVWAALVIAAVTVVAELFIIAVGASVVPQAGVSAETARLLHEQDEDRAI